MRTNKAVRAAMVMCVAALALTGCSSGANAQSTSGPITLTFWSWAPNAQQVVDVWNKENPDVQVQLTNAGGGNDSAAKLLTSSRAGNAPDVAAVEYQTLPSLVSAGVARDITSDVGDVSGNYSASAMQQVTFDGHVFALPQDLGPTSMLYRKDLFEKYDIPVPATWQQFADDAALVKKADPDAYIASIPPDQMGFFAAVSAEAGAQWWSYSDGTWKVGIDDKPTLEVADFFQNLADRDLVSTEPLLTPDWNAKVNSGEIWTWPSAIWATGVLQGIAPKTDGDWAIAPMPQWTAGATAVPYQGGSSLIVTKNCQHPQQALDFIKWYNASQEGATLILTAQGAYPAATSGQEAAKQSAPPALTSDQPDYYQVASDLAQHGQALTWGPDANLAQSTLTSKLDAAITNGTSWSDAFVATQKAVVKDMKKTGYQLSD